MYKRFFSILLISVLSFSLVACGDTATEQTAQVEDSTDQQTTEGETDTQLAQEAVIEDTAEPEVKEAAKAASFQFSTLLFSV